MEIGNSIYTIGSVLTVRARFVGRRRAAPGRPAPARKINWRRLRVHRRGRGEMWDGAEHGIPSPRAARGLPRSAD